MSGGAAVQCLPCGKKLVIRDMSSHIHEHIQYFPQSCKDCDFRCVNKSALDLHTFETDHTGSACFDPYKQWLVDTINDDCRFAAKFGVDELLKRKNITGHSPTQPSLIVTPAQQHQRRTSTVVPPLPLRYVALSSSDSDDEPQQVAARPKVPAVVVKRNSGVQSRRPEPPAKEKSEADDSEPSKDSDDEEIVKLRQELNDTVKCGLCTTLEAFPKLVWTSTQCPKCPREIKSARGRISHVYNAHHTYLQPLGCPKAPCPFTSFDPHEFKKHFVESHGSGTNWKLSLGNTRLERDFPAAFAEHRRKIEAISRLLFPLDLPLRILDKAKKKGKSRGGDYDDDNLLMEISASAAAAPSKRTDARTAQKRRCSPVTVSSSSDSSDDDKPSGSKKCAAAVQKPRASVKQEIREEDQEEDSSDSSRATVAGGTVNSKKNGEVVVKKEEDVKQERTATTTTTTTVPQRSVVPPTVLRRTFPKKTSSMSPITKTSSMSPSTTGGQARHIQLMYNGRGGGWRGDRGRGGFTGGFDRGRGGGGGWTETIPLPSMKGPSDGGRSAGYGEGRGGWRGTVTRGRDGFNTASDGGYGRGR
ncbi:hypothetical protein PRIPAC_79434 [Pristionchus pacificus]|uniref:C2H2-type domain-containing protein n=1 Tax=Pristionchus pacificus TaxID=54126 RepID=A0A2A6BX11_PRIPA|nr:hypothetical protein PRIPAC_79434 [Pristionchus pacificus]|eukprot:PDM70301.1 hypothetical protein PRIPAC_46547 [Pristionchus pacificus]